MRILAEFFLIYLPPMVANGSPVVISKIVKTHPIDRGKKWRDGRRILGDGKSFEGMFGGIAAGGITAALLGLYSGSISEVATTGIVSSVGAILGDIIKSFFKRRMGIERGGMLPIADQLDFYLGSTLAILLCRGCLHPSLESFVLGLILIPLLHVLTNYIAFKLKLKSVPW
ncbi:MAG: CDP-2,3-bis-(O-geranylgeranyl)-sn-glycerol synthase [Fervidicoccaceae archaeon]